MFSRRKNLLFLDFVNADPLFYAILIIRRGCFSFFFFFSVFPRAENFLTRFTFTRFLSILKRFFDLIEGVFGKDWRYTATSLLESFFKRERLGKSVFIYRLDLGTRENQQGKILFTSFRRHFSTAPHVNEIVTVHRAQSMLLFTFFSRRRLEGKA